MSNYKNKIGDGKLPNKYWVFHRDEKFKRIKQDDGSILIEIIKEDNTKKESLLGEFKTYKEALNCVNNKVYLPHVVIEDRLTGQLFESLCIVCQECHKEEYKTIEDISFSKKKIEESGHIFE